MRRSDAHPTNSLALAPLGRVRVRGHRRERVVEGPFRTVSKELKDGDPLKQNTPKGHKPPEPPGTKTADRG